MTEEHAVIDEQDKPSGNTFESMRLIRLIRLLHLAFSCWLFNEAYCRW